MMDTGIAMLFAGVAAWSLGYGPVEMLASQGAILMAEFTGRRVIDWYTTRKR